MRYAFAVAASVLVSSAGMAWSQEKPGAAAPAEHSGAALMRSAADYLKGLQSYSFEFRAYSRMEADGFKSEYRTDYAATVERPGKLALRRTWGAEAPVVVSDGTTVTHYVPYLKAYVTGKTPEKAEEMLSVDGQYIEQMIWTLRAPGLRTAIASDPVAVLAPIAQVAQDKGVEEVNGVRAHHLTAALEGQELHLWIAAEGKPVLVRAEMPGEDRGAGAMGWQNFKATTVTEFSNWREGPAAKDAFVFAAPAGTRKVTSLEKAFMPDMDDEGGDQPEEVSLEGKAAPNFTLDVLGGGKLDLASLTKDKVVVLDFWATWCPPCRRGLPILDKVAKELDSEKVAVFAVNLQEDEGTVKKFIEKQKLGLKVAMDTKGEVAQSYGANSIPMTVIIGKGGTVQAVHVGFSDDMEEDLRGQIKTLVEGGTLVKEKAAGEDAADNEKAVVAGEERLVELWRAKGQFTGLAVDPKTSSFYAASGRKVVEFNSKGEKVGETPIHAGGSTLRLANLTGDAAPEFLMFQTWGPSVQAFDRKGEELWASGEDSGIDDVGALDLTGDGLQETIIGFNGGTGLWALKPDGQKLWANTSIGNVWHVTGGVHNGKPVVVTTSAAGQVHLFDTQGKKLRNLDSGVYANMVRLGKGDGGPCVLVGGSVMGAGRKSKLIRMDMDGKRAWALDLPGPDHILSMAACDQADYAAVGMGDGSVHVVDTAAGKLLATIKTRCSNPEVAWWWDAGEKRAVLGVVTIGGVRVMGVKGE